jgi:hypothetical protein
MTQRHWILGLAAFVLGVAALGLVRADEPKKDAKVDEKAKKASDEAGKIATAFMLADLGRMSGSAEALIAAAKLLNSVDEATAIKDAKPVEGKDNSKPPAAGELTKGKEEGTDFSATVKELLDDAEKLAKNDDKVLAVIKSVKVNAGRGVASGPTTLSANIAVSGNTHTWYYNFVPNLPGTVTVTSNSGRYLTLEVYNAQGQLRGSQTGRVCSVSWTPEAGHNPFSIRVTNSGQAANTYTMVTN